MERQVSVLERLPEKSRKGQYRISDPFVATWFAFVHPHRDRLERGRNSEVMRKEIAPQLPRWLGRAVEPVLMDLLPSAGIVPFEVAFRGRAWTREAELDIVLLDEERQKAFVAEVKWGAQAVSVGVMDDLRQRVALVPDLRPLALTLAIVSRAGFIGKRPLKVDERLVDMRRLPLFSQR